MTAQSSCVTFCLKRYLYLPQSPCSNSRRPTNIRTTPFPCIRTPNKICLRTITSLALDTVNPSKLDLPTILETSVSCICGYLHFTRDLQYESFYLSQYILQFIIYKNGLSWRSRFTEQYICESFTSTVYSDILLYPLKHFKAHSDINENNQQCYERIA